MTPIYFSLGFTENQLERLELVTRVRVEQSNKWAYHLAPNFARRLRHFEDLSQADSSHSLDSETLRNGWHPRLWTSDVEVAKPPIAKNTK